MTFPGRRIAMSKPTDGNVRKRRKNAAERMTASGDAGPLGWEITP